MMRRAILLLALLIPIRGHAQTAHDRHQDSIAHSMASHQGGGQQFSFWRIVARSTSCSGLTRASADTRTTEILWKINNGCESSDARARPGMTMWDARRSK
jgi:hypothetical protein